jgi:CheY-like chemotaxis protein
MLESSANKVVLRECIILEADDGSTAIDALRSETEAGRAVDLVLMDYVMVRMNGPEAARRMRIDLGYRGGLIGITGNALPEDLDTFRDHGANMVLTKPLTNNKLMDAIRETNSLLGMGRMGDIV